MTIPSLTVIDRQPLGEEACNAGLFLYVEYAGRLTQPEAISLSAPVSDIQTVYRRSWEEVGLS